LLSSICEGVTKCDVASHSGVEEIGQVTCSPGIKKGEYVYLSRTSPAAIIAQPGNARLHWLFSLKGAGRLFRTSPSQSLAKRLHVEDGPQNGAKDGVLATRITAISIAAVIAIFIAATEALAKVIVVFVLGYIKTIIAIVRVLIGIRALVVGSPVILPVGLSGEEALLITVVHGFSKQISAVLIRLVIAAAAVITIVRSRVEVGIIVVIVAIIPQAHLLLAYVLEVLLLITIL
jgi:hypothetical protein